MGRVPVTRIVAFVLVAALVAAGWLLLGPAQLGGPARYAIIDGSSMAPTLTDGDLVVVRVDGEPAKGEVVLYRDPRLGVDVLHRVLRQTGGRFVLKGDGNDYADDARPTAAELQGTLWFSVPHLGAVVEWLRQPLHAGLVVFVLVALAFAGGEGAARRRSRPLWRAGAALPLSTRAAAARVLLAGAAAAAALFAVLSFAAFSLSTSRAETVDEARVHAATLSYSADVEASGVYPDGTVDAGETAFLQLVPALDVSAVYRFSAEGGADVRGRAAISAVVSDGAGWTREIPVAAPSEFSGSSVTVSGKLDLEELDGIVDEMRSLTGSLTTTFAVLLRTRVELSGRAGGDRLDEEFVPEIRFLLDDVGLRLDASADAAPTLSVRKAEPGTVEASRSLRLGGLELAIGQARRLSVLGLALSALLLLVALGLAPRTDSGEHARFAARFADRVISIARAPVVDPERVTDVADVETLGRISERYDRLILHWRLGDEHTYLVHDGSHVYRCRTGHRERDVAVSDLEDTLVFQE
jgi:signal peptidase